MRPQRIKPSTVFPVCALAALLGYGRVAVAEDTEQAPDETDLEREDGAASRFNSRGLSLRGGIGLSLCAGFDDNADDERPFGCNSFADGDLGPALFVFAGWRFLGWGTAELGYTHAFHSIQKKKGCGYITRRTDFWYAPRLGMRAHPLQSRRRVEPVLGIHLGYVNMQHNFDALDVAPETCFEVMPSTSRIRGVQLDASIGLEIHLTEVLSLGVELTAFENLWLEDASGREFDGEYNDFFFNLDLLLSAVFG